ncbi:MAG: hypothetical protein ACOX0O_11005 [Candidatus Methanoculleus thermohydrogenotrophicum]
MAATSDPRSSTTVSGDYAAETGVLFNNAAGRPGDVTIPSVVRGRHHLVAISTRGKSPAVARYLRMRLESEYADLDLMIDLQDEVRSMLKETRAGAGEAVSASSGVYLRMRRSGEHACLRL